MNLVERCLYSCLENLKEIGISLLAVYHEMEERRGNCMDIDFPSISGSWDRIWDIYKRELRPSWALFSLLPGERKKPHQKVPWILRG